MDAESLVTMGVISNNGMEIANLGYSGRYRTNIIDLLEIISELQTEIDFTVTLYDATINIETNMCTFIDIKAQIKKETDIEATLQLEQYIKTRLVQDFESF